MAVFIIVGCFILFDVVTGFIKALYSGRGLNSTLLRQGLFHKLSELLAVFGSYLLELGANYIELGFDIPAVNAVAIYICVMELVSILENLTEVNPTLAKLFAPYLEKIKERSDTTDDT